MSEILDKLNARAREKHSERLVEHDASNVKRKAFFKRTLPIFGVAAGALVLLGLSYPFYQDYRVKSDVHDSLNDSNGELDLYGSGKWEPQGERGAYADIDYISFDNFEALLETGCGQARLNSRSKEAREMEVCIEGDRLENLRQIIAFGDIYEINFTSSDHDGSEALAALQGLESDPRTSKAARQEISRIDRLFDEADLIHSYRLNKDYVNNEFKRITPDYDRAKAYLELSKDGSSVQSIGDIREISDIISYTRLRVDSSDFIPESNVFCSSNLEILFSNKTKASLPVGCIENNRDDAVDKIKELLRI